MANVNFKHGLLPVNSPNGDSPPGTRYPLKQAISGLTTAYTTKLYKGQPVKMGTGGYVIAIIATDTTNMLGISGEYYAGTSVGVDARQTNILVHDRKDQEYVGQMATSAATTDISYLIQKNIALTSVDDGNTNNGYSAAALTGATHDTDKPFRIIGAVHEAGAGALSGYSKLRVVINQGWLWRDVTTGIA